MVDELGELLTTSIVAIPGAVYTPLACRGDAWILRLADATVELEGSRRADENRQDDDN